MRKEYKDRLDACHAPESLKQQTIKRMKEELERIEDGEPVSDEKPEKIRRYRGWQAVAAAAAFVMIAGITYSHTAYYSRLYQEIPKDSSEEWKSPLYGGPLKFADKKIDVEEYEEYLDVDFKNLIEGYQMTENDITVYFGKKMEWEEDQGKMTYQQGDKYTVTLEVSGSGSLVKGEEKNTKGTQLNHTEVFFAQMQEGEVTQLTAFWEVDGIQYLARTETLSQKGFYKIIKKIIENLQ